MSDRGYDAYAQGRGMSYRKQSRERGIARDADDDVSSLTDSESDPGSDARRSRRSRSRRNSRAIVKREQYEVPAPPRVYQPADSVESFEQVYGHRSPVRDRGRRLPERQRETGLLVAVALFAAGFFFCLNECCD